MNRNMKRIVRIMKRIMDSVFLILFIGILAGGAFFLYVTATDYRPPERLALEVMNNTGLKLQERVPFSVITFNLGYGGLDAEQDFFLDGGTRSRASSREQTLENLEGVTRFLDEHPVECVLLQEVDVRASRSYKLDELRFIRERAKPYGSTFGLNFKVPWVPVPLSAPMGTVQSGLLTLTKFKVNSAYRYQYPGLEKWPRRLFELDRCFIETRIPVETGKDLVLINSHFSAFDEGGRIRKQQLEFLSRYITAEYQEGHYVIVGGDFNHVLPGSDPQRFMASEAWPFWLQKLPAELVPSGFQWGIDPSIPSVRTLAALYQPGFTFQAVIDGFLVSPNIEILQVQGTNLDFAHSDHNPVKGLFKLKFEQSEL